MYFISSSVRSKIPIFGVRTGVVKASRAIVSLKADNSHYHIFFNQERYSFETLSLLVGLSYAMFLSWAKYLQISPF